ncbi:hypothetical protein J0667_04420 [Methylomonas sp. WH-1]|uniref:hypothetical protein n=1 Tax=unclassified Methylomonas TaxID=2608980 RepID=UPI00051BBAD9|nr:MULTISPECIES: hypothetical protein [unclassified Methylomonas]
MLKKTRMIVGLVISSLALVSMSLAANASNEYAESSIGDFNSGQLFTLQDTNNIFKGTHGWSDEGNFDGFRFVVQEGRQAIIDFNYSFIGLAANEAQAWVWDLSSLPAGTSACTPQAGLADSCSFVFGSQHITSQIFESQAGFANPSSWNFVNFDQLRLTAGTYLLADNFRFDNLSASQTITGVFSYSINIQQTPVPLPASVLLFGTFFWMPPLFRRLTM